MWLGTTTQRHHLGSFPPVVKYARTCRKIARNNVSDSMSRQTGVVLKKGCGDTRWNCALTRSTSGRTSSLSLSLSCNFTMSSTFSLLTSFSVFFAQVIPFPFPAPTFYVHAISLLPLLCMRYSLLPLFCSFLLCSACLSSLFFHNFDLSHSFSSCLSSFIFLHFFLIRLIFD